MAQVSRPCERLPRHFRHITHLAAAFIFGVLLSVAASDDCAFIDGETSLKFSTVFTITCDIVVKYAREVHVYDPVYA